MRFVDTSKHRKTQQRGFTIVEIAIVVVVIGILSGIIAVSYNGAQVRAKSAVLQSRMEVVKAGLDMYFLDHGVYPKSAPWDSMGPNDPTGVWPLNNLDDVTAEDLKSPFDTTGSVTSFREEGAYAEAAHGSGGKIGYVSVRATALQQADPMHWTCFHDDDVCTAYRVWYRLGDGTLKTSAGGKNPPE